MQSEWVSASSDGCFLAGLSSHTGGLPFVQSKHLYPCCDRELGQFFEGTEVFVLKRCERELSYPAAKQEISSGGAGKTP